MASTVGESTWVGPVIALLCVVGVLGTALWVFAYCLRQRERRADLNNPAMRVMAEYESNKRAWERAQMAKRWGWLFATKKTTNDVQLESPPRFPIVLESADGSPADFEPYNLDVPGLPPIVVLPSARI